MLGFAPLASTALADDIGFAAYDLVADAGSFVATGQDANFATSEIIGTGVFTCTAQDAGLFLTKVADAGSFSATGQDANLLPVVVIDVDPGIFALTGQQNELTRNYALAVDAGAFTLTFTDTDTATSIKADTGYFALQGQDTNFIETKIIVAEAGNFNLTAGEATITLVLTLPAATGTFTLAGQNIGIGQLFRIDGVGVFTLDGQDVGINPGRARRFEYANKNTQAVLSQANANSVIVTSSKNEAA